MMSGAWPPPAPSVWKAWMVRPLKAAMVVSTKPDSLSVSVWIATWTSISSATARQQSIGGGGRAPVLVQLEPAGTGRDLLAQRLGQAGIALAQEADIDRPGLHRLQHPADVPGAGGAGGGGGARGRAGAAAEQGGEAGGQRLVQDLRADEVDVGVDPAGGDDPAFAGDGLGAGADDDVDAGLGLGVAGLADGGDPAVLEADVGLDDAPMVEDQRVGDHGVDGTGRAGLLPLPHAVADHLAAAELDLLAVDGAVLLDLDHEVGVGEAHPVAHGRPEHVGVGRARHAEGHQSAPMIFWLKPYTLRLPP